MPKLARSRGATIPHESPQPQSSATPAPLPSEPKDKCLALYQAYSAAFFKCQQMPNFDACAKASNLGRLWSDMSAACKK